MSDEASDLQWEFSRDFQERNWTLTRVGWAVMLLIVIAALSGLTGSRGPLSYGKAEASGATLTYPRIARWRAAEAMEIEFPPGASGQLDVLLPQSFTDVFTIESVMPRPAKVTATGEGQLFEFSLGADSGSKRASFSLRPRRPAWPADAQVIVGDSMMDLSITVLP